ncbi:recombinase family protein [Sphingorhabdus arenilitoris]|uniref:Recombinase family protein n=1 Tax=Sphingorhabdus arenilitoris TaxID=1490041 RepID=A0ABV8RGR8_9SPHN
MTQPRAKHRCAIYTRKSTEEGLEQEFNTLDAQRQACEAYILSQAGEGWEVIPKQYDDGGWSGGNMQRPAVKELLDDVARGRIDIIVVYKVDRLTRSLMDFARMVETLDKHEVSFVSVTQAFNTTNSMGRLTLNVLLSFAQFEREVTGERIRDKIAASKARGMWMGGNVPLGYNLGERKLLINTVEADQIRMMFARYLKLKSVPKLTAELNRNAIRTKSWTSGKGRTHGGVNFSCGAVYHILRNSIYVGEIAHKGNIHEGEHDAIIERGLFDKVQAQIAAQRVTRSAKKTRSATGQLTGKIYDGEGQPMRTTFGYGRGKKIYRYYASETILPNGKAQHSDNHQGIRLSAERIERLIIAQLGTLIPDSKARTAIFDAITKVVIDENVLRVRLDAAELAREDETHQQLLERIQLIDKHVSIGEDIINLSIDARPIKRGRTVRARTHLLDDVEAKQVLAELIKTSHRKLDEHNASPLYPENHAQMTTPVNKWSRERNVPGLLAPDIQKALLRGDVPKRLDIEILLSRDMPLDWEEQRRLLGFE